MGPDSGRPAVLAVKLQFASDDLAAPGPRQHSFKEAAHAGIAAADILRAREAEAADDGNIKIDQAVAAAEIPRPLPLQLVFEDLPALVAIFHGLVAKAGEFGFRGRRRRVAVDVEEHLGWRLEVAGHKKQAAAETAALGLVKGGGEPAQAVAVGEIEHDGRGLDQGFAFGGDQSRHQAQGIEGEKLRREVLLLADVNLAQLVGQPRLFEHDEWGQSHGCAAAVKQVFALVGHVVLVR